MVRAEPMIRLLSVSDHEYAPLSAVEEVRAANTELYRLSARCLELSREIALMHQLVERLAQSADSCRREHRARGEHESMEASSALGTNPVRSELARACRIALMETSEPASVEAIYDRIKRRGSFTFVRYKHPFRSIVLAMSAMVRSGEVSLLNEAGHRRWRWGTERMEDKSGQGTSFSTHIPQVPGSTEDNVRRTWRT